MITASQVIDDALRMRGSEGRKLYEIHTFRAGGRLAGVDLDDNATLLALMDEPSLGPGTIHPTSGPFVGT